MKVSYITMLFPSPVETFACNDVTALRDMGVDVCVHSLKFRHKRTEEFVKERKLEGVFFTHNSLQNTFRGVVAGAKRPATSFYLSAWVIKNTFRNPLHLLKSFILLPRVLQLFNDIKLINPDVVHLFWGHYPSLVGCLVKKGLPQVVLSISLGAYDLGMRYGGSKYMLEKADIATTFARVNIKELIALGAPERKIKIIYRGIDREKYGKWTSDIEKEKGKIITVGRMIPGKKMSDVLKVFSEVSKKRKGLSLIVLGEGPLLEETKKLTHTLCISDSVSFEGHVSHERVLRELQTSEVFLFMSCYENERLSNVVKEAMFCKAFCVVTKTSGIEELLPDTRYGCIVPRGDVRFAADAVDHFFEQPGKYKCLLERAHNRIVENFNVKIEMRKLKKAWEELLSEKKI